MKRFVPLLVIAVAVAAFLFRDRILPAAPGPNAWLGAVEAHMTLVGPLSAGRIESVKVSKGSKVEKGNVLFTLDASTTRAQVAQAAAAVNTAQQTLNDLKQGKRPDELAVYDLQRVEADANLKLAQENYLRSESMNNNGLIAQAQFDTAKNAVAVAQSRIAQLEATKKAFDLPGRDAAIAAAQSRVVEAQSALDQAQARLDDSSVAAPATAQVDDVFFSAGEVVAAGQPVISLLADDALVLRFYVPEPVRTKLIIGAEVRFHCDSCAANLAATVSHIYAVPEFTPPVIYSENARGKLVFQVEAKIIGAHRELQPGLPVQIEPLP